ncbi:MAG: hypothetical protein IPJ03_16420 [Ignavibacteriales bacterium]|nr:hypothetical protein [Ignavibacteriales bacterium]
MRNYELITFLDHHAGDKKPAMCQIVGEVTHENNIYLNIRYWTVLDMESGDAINDDINDEIVTIIKSTILTRLKSKGWE